MEELEHFLRVLVEGTLYKTIREIKKGKFPNEEEMIKEAIQNFEDTLPENLQQVANKHSVIIDAVNKAEKNVEEMKRIRAQEEQER